MVGQRVVVVVSGNRYHGKSTLADMIAGMIDDSRRDSFADPIKMCVHLKTGIPLEILNGSKEVKDNLAFGRYGKSPRALMVEEGWETRERIAKSVWVDRLAERAQAAPERVTVVSDGRVPEEELQQVADLLGEHGLAIAVRVVRPDVPVERGHPLEDLVADAPDSIFDVVVRNDADLDALRNKAQQVADFVVLYAKTGGKRLTSDEPGWAVWCPDGGRYREAQATEADAVTLALQRMMPHPCCGTFDSHTVAPVVFDLIEAR